MENKLLKNFTRVSTVLFFMFLGLYVYAQIADPHLPTNAPPVKYPRISFSHNFNVTVAKDNGGNLIFFNQDEPFFGGTFKFAGDKTTIGTGWNGYGIYFFHIVHTVDKAHNWWTMMINLWYLIIFFGVFPGIYIIKKLRSRSSKLAQ